MVRRVPIALLLVLGACGGAHVTSATSPRRAAPPAPVTVAPAPPATTTTTTRPRTYLEIGDAGPKVVELQQRLAALGYRPGAANGVYGAETASAVLAFEKREGLERDGLAGDEVRAALADPHGAGPRPGPVPRIEVDLARQVAFVVLAGQPVVTLNASTGSGERYRDPGGGMDVAYTPVGSFTVERKIEGDHVAPLGTLHDPMYFVGGWAIHGAGYVPGYPASHGCVRVSDSDADWLFPQVAIGTPVEIYGGTPAGPAGAAPGS
jgi:peptidoglycan hydrolase-like protein with peptidoglycan-binding domain